jgi:hypothetical protein
MTLTTAWWQHQPMLYIPIDEFMNEASKSV